MQTDTLVRPLAKTRVRRLNVLGTGFSMLTPQTTVEQISYLIQSGETGYVTVTNADGAVRSLETESLRQIYNQSYLTTPDGMPIVWFAKARGEQEMSRVYGPDLMLRLFIEGRRQGWKHFFYGGREGVAEELKSCLQERFPGSEVVGTYCPPFRDLTEVEERELIDQVAALKPDIFWVGISSPRQDQFMSKMVGKLDAAVLIGVGAAFDFHSGKVKQAPTWMQGAGLEWFYRVLAEPRRLWRRYAYTVPRFLFHSIAQLLRLRAYKELS